MPYPSIVFNTISDWENYLNTNVVTNGSEDITGLIGNNAYNGAVTFIKQSPLNWAKAAVVSAGGDVNLTNNFLGVVVFTTITPDSLSFADNFYHQYVFLNMTNGAIQLDTPSAYYDLTGSPVDNIPANTAVVLYRAQNDLWVLGNNSGGGGSTQKQPKTYIVGTTPGAPTAGANTWTLSDFANSYVVLFVNGALCDQVDAGDGSPYLTKVLASTTVTIGNYTDGWVAGDKLNYILITP